jgi:hypothetical protein
MATAKPPAPRAAAATAKPAAPAKPAPAKAAAPKPPPLTLESTAKLLKRKQIQATPGPDSDLYDALLFMRDEIERLQRNLRDLEVKVQRLGRHSREPR